ncbi:ATP-binding protein [Cohnella massiliensis]|uniref:ATP-binding protein n=1 Tax=Cohnella massiliensis TaxID=1816691 RepID=UPI001FE25E2C|nr:ATP-binding protein [Cohnella massiliensis]
MTIRSKLALFISILIAVILMLNIWLYYYSTKNQMQRDAENQMNAVARQVGATMEAMQQSRRLIEETLGERLRIAAIAAANRLGPEYRHVENDQLAELSRELGVDHITLWRKTEDDIVVVRSSDPKEIGLSSKNMDYWYDAFVQLFEQGNVTIPQGQKLDRFWSGPINFASSDPERINKWGYYYDGTTDYMINPFIHAEVFVNFERDLGTDSIVQKLLDSNPDLLEITGFDPEFFGKPPIIKYKQGQPVRNLDVRDIVFGTYSYVNQTEKDAALVGQAARTGEMVTVPDRLNGTNVIRSFIPIQGDKTYVYGVTFNRNSIDETLNRQMLILTLISVALIALSIVASYLLSGVMIRSLHRIVTKVNEIAGGIFGQKLSVRSKDELGLLASRVNTMEDNLQYYMSGLKNTAAELSDTKQYLESLVNHTSDAIHVADLQGRVTQVNHAFEGMYGWSEAEVLGRPLDNIPPDQVRDWEDIRRTVLEGGAVTDRETVRYTKDGTPIDLSITVSSIRNEQGEIVAIATISRNITNRKQTEEMLRRSEKLSVVGQLAAGIAHEIRNPLTTLIGFVQLQQKKGSLPGVYLDVMLSELDRINYIVSELLFLAKPQASVMEMANVADILGDISLLLESQARISNVRIVTNIPANLPKVKCAINQLKQVFVNVIKNGIEAMPDGGTLRIEAETLEDSGGLLLRVCDNGCGIPEETLSRLGEPFYSTKPTGNGLGVMVSQQIIANHKGTIDFRSAPGEGTTVEIRLPSRDDSDSPDFATA